MDKKLIKEIKRVGNSLGIIFDTEDKKFFGIEKGDFIEISDLIVIKKKNPKRK